VSTLAGSSGRGLVDGTALSARFSWPYGVAVGSSEGDVYVADSGNNCVRRVDKHTGETTLLAGSIQPGYQVCKKLIRALNLPYPIPMCVQSIRTLNLPYQVLVCIRSIRTLNLYYQVPMCIQSI
jgi:hypothetical protein